jgi:cellulase (glycosyl hydrolase family 5)
VKRWPIAAASAAAAAALWVGCGDGGGGPTPSARAPWSIIEDHTPLIRSGERRRELTLREMRAIGADTLRVAVKWSEVAPGAESSTRPAFDATDPALYRGFAPYDDLVRRATDKGFRLLLDLAPDAPRWATADGAPLGPETANREPDPREFARFAAAVGKRYSGDFEGLPKVEWFSLWNEPNHHFFLKPNADAPRIYREMVAAALPALRDAAGDDANVLVGETAPIRVPGSVLGPRDFLQRFLCLDKDFLPTPDEPGCQGLGALDVDGYAHHPYGPTSKAPQHADIISLLVIRRLGDYLDSAAAAGRLPAGLPLYSTEFGLQSNPPDPTARITLEEQAALINEKEEQSYRYPRLRSYAQYLLYDDPPRPGTTLKQIWSGFQTGLRFTDGEAKPSYSAYQFPIVVQRSSDGGVRVWGRVRPGSGVRSVEVQEMPARRSVRRLETNDAGYFEVSVQQRAAYRFIGYDGDGKRLGVSRVAEPINATPPSE